MDLTLKAADASSLLENISTAAPSQLAENTESSGEDKVRDMESDKFRDMESDKGGVLEEETDSFGCYTLVTTGAVELPATEVGAALV